jgi:hypothetical protein
VQLSDIANSLSQSVQPTRRLTHEQIRDARVRLAGAIESANRYINVETMRGTKKYSLKTLVISGRLGRLKEDELISARYSDGRPTKSYLNFRRQLNRGIILGDPGGGKSTLTQLLCFDLARTILLEDKNPDRLSMRVEI